jgi:hypothetical protein
VRACRGRRSERKDIAVEKSCYCGQAKNTSAHRAADGQGRSTEWLRRTGVLLTGGHAGLGSDQGDRILVLVPNTALAAMVERPGDMAVSVWNTTKSGKPWLSALQEEQRPPHTFWILRTSTPWLGPYCWAQGKQGGDGGTSGLRKAFEASTTQPRCNHLG